MFLIICIFVREMFCICEIKHFCKNSIFVIGTAIICMFQALLTLRFKQRGLPYHYRKICDIGIFPVPRYFPMFPQHFAPVGWLQQHKHSKQQLCW